MVSLVGTFAESFDEAFVRVAFKTKRASMQARAEATVARIMEAARLYADADARGLLFPEPPAAVLPCHETLIFKSRRFDVVDLDWPSAYPVVSDFYDVWLDKCPKTRTAHARWFRHKTPRPALICLHGWGAGAFPFEERAYRARYFHSLGMDVVLTTLPFHARRAQSSFGRPLFPSSDPFCSNEGFAQAIFDVRSLIRRLKQRGADRVAVTGMSLGGFTSALLATVAPEVDTIVPVIPFASLAKMLWYHGQGTVARAVAEQEGFTLRLLEKAFGPINPLRRTPTVGPEDVLIIAGERDRVTPPEHAHLLHEHFSTPDTEAGFGTFPGGHLIQAGRAQLFRQMASFLASRGYSRTEH